MFERHETGESAILVHIDFNGDSEREDPDEFYDLVKSASVEPLLVVTGKRNRPSSKFFVGEGKLKEILEAKEQYNADVVLFNHSLSPSQQRNIERRLECRVIDRTGVILDIFAQRARTHEGKLQVELAQLEYISTRLIRGWTHLERQKGGIGLRGPGETQLESDRRLLRARIKSINKKLEKVRKQREQGRRARQRAEIPAISLVGYTNAGKSTLFNVMTDSGVYAADQLFATLDPTIRRLKLPDVGAVVLADTVGFIHHLPHKLIEAFRSTLEETCNATLLLHIVDCHDNDRNENIEQVKTVLYEIGAGEIPVLTVYNKLDLLDDRLPRLDRNEEGIPERVWLSAATGEGLDILLSAISERLAESIVQKWLHLSPSKGKLRARFFEAEAVIEESISKVDGGIDIHIRMPVYDYHRIIRESGYCSEASFTKDYHENFIK